VVKITYYLEVLSSWCHWAEPAWAELQHRYAGRVQFNWKIALMPAEAFPVSASQCEWFYRRSGTINRSPYMLNSGWFEPGAAPYPVPNQVAEAARSMGAVDDRVRLALSEAAVRQGRKVGRWEVAGDIAAAAGSLDPVELKSRAGSEEIRSKVAQTTAEFHALQVSQRPAFLIENGIGDRAVFSGVVRSGPLASALDALLDDEAAYTSWEAHFGKPPPT
jgi:predicted DsbA family dithiol-disulfide isomerase